MASPTGGKTGLTGDHSSGDAPHPGPLPEGEGGRIGFAWKVEKVFSSAQGERGGRPALALAGRKWRIGPQSRVRPKTTPRANSPAPTAIAISEAGPRVLAAGSIRCGPTAATRAPGTANAAIRTPR